MAEATIVGFPCIDKCCDPSRESFHVGDLVGILHGPLRPREQRKARVQINSEWRADFEVSELLWNLAPNGDGTYSTQ